MSLIPYKPLLGIFGGLTLGSFSVLFGHALYSVYRARAAAHRTRKESPLLMACRNFDFLSSDENGSGGNGGNESENGSGGGEKSFPDGQEYIPVIPMDAIKTISDPQSKTIALLLEKEGLDCPVAITLNVSSTVQLIYALRLALRRVERCSIPFASGW